MIEVETRPMTDKELDEFYRNWLFAFIYLLLLFFAPILAALAILTAVT